MTPIRRTEDELTRRDFARHLARTAFGLAFVSALPSFLRAQAAPSRAKAKRVIYLYMQGGMSHLDTLDPKPGREVQGPTETVKTAVPGVLLGASLARTAGQMKEIALVRSLHSKEGAHERARYQLHTGYPPLSSLLHPATAAWVAKFAPRLNADLPPFVAVGDAVAGAGFFENTFAPFRVGDPEQALANVVPPKYIPHEIVERRIKLMKALNEPYLERWGRVAGVKDYASFYDQALALMHARDLEAFDLSKESDAAREGYGKNRFGQGCLLARRLIERDVRWVEVAWGNWDTHQDNFTSVEKQAAILDQGLGALLEDLKARGLLGETLVVLCSEFGRTPRINEGKGRDHHPDCFSALLAGGAVKGGSVWGESDEDGRKPKRDPATPMDLSATIVAALGLDPAKEVVSPAGRPFLMGGGGAPIAGILA
ncbi:MAG: DUF1501 domain-containing protein [Spirochaetes bacterium]|nr:DUF1501 domain-containing protein [Spirochaetota bacterium]